MERENTARMPISNKRTVQQKDRCWKLELQANEVSFFSGIECYKFAIQEEEISTTFIQHKPRKENDNSNSVQIVEYVTNHVKQSNKTNNPNNPIQYPALIASMNFPFRQNAVAMQIYFELMRH